MLSLTQFHLLGNTRQDALSNTAYLFQSPLSFCSLLHAHDKSMETEACRTQTMGIQCL